MTASAACLPPRMRLRYFPVLPHEVHVCHSTNIAKKTAIPNVR